MTGRCVAGQSPISSSEAIRVVMDDNYPPYAFKDESGQLKGIIVDQWRLWEKKTGIRAELTGMEWDEALRRMRQGEFDVIDTIFRTEEREQVFDFTRPYARLDVPLFFHRDISGIRGADDVRGFVVAAKAGDSAVEVLRQHGVSSIVQYPSYEKLVEAARDGKVKVFIMDAPPAQYFLHKFGIQDQFRKTAPLYSGEFHRAVLKGNPLLRTVENGFAAITRDEYQRIDRLWLGTPLTDSPLFRYVWYLAGGVVLLVVLLLGWLRSLKRAVAVKTRDLADSEARYRSLVDNIPLGITLIDRNHRIVMVNQTQAEMFNQTKEWFGGRFCYEEFEKRERTCPYCPGVQAMASGEVAQVDTQGVLDDGRRMEVRVRAVPLRDANQVTTGFIEVIEDITERKLAQQTIENERARLRALLRTIPDLVWLKDLSGVYLACNHRFEMFFGASEAEIIGKTDYDFVDAGLADFFRKNDRRAIEADRACVNEELVVFASDGHRELLETIKTPVRDAEGHLFGVLGIARDMTALKDALDKLRNQAELLDLAHDAIIVRDLDNRITFWNRGAAEQYGWTREEAVGQVTHALLRTEFTLPMEEIMGTLFDTGAWDGELQHMTRAGSRLVVASRWALQRDENGRPLAILEINNDITEKRRLEEQMRHAQKLESLGVLAGGIAHDFNNILTTIIGNNELALLRLGQESPVRDNLQRIGKAAARAADLAKQMLAYSGKGKFIVEAVDLNRLVEEMGHMLEVSISKKVTLRYDLTRPLPTVEADATQLRQIVMNLVINASEAIGDQDGTITVATGCLECDEGCLKELWTSDRLRSGLYVSLEIGDTGCGMDKETMSRLFDPFFTTKFTGRGLGMAAVLGIVRGHKGAINVYSEPGKGSTFRILLPACAQEVSPMDSDDHQVWRGSGVALLVDDEQPVREVGAEILQELGFQVLTAGDGREALEIYSRRQDIDLVILDLTMPHMDGGETLRELQRLDPKVKVIMSSGFSAQEIARKFAGTGLAGIVQKPYRLKTLREVLMSL